MLGLDGVPGTSVNRFCASSVQTTRMAFHAIKAGEGDVFVSAGVECVSRYMALQDGERATSTRRSTRPASAPQAFAQSNAPWTDPRANGQVPDVYIAMGQTAENVATLRGVSRLEQDEWGVESQNRAEKAIADGFFEREITPVTLPDGTVVSKDDGPRAGTTLDKVQTLQPVFRPTGTVTAGNACPLNDGAAALVVMSDTKAQELGLTPLARIVATGVSALSPEIMGLGPVDASKQALARAGMTPSDIDLWEINEAFAAQVLPSRRGHRHPAGPAQRPRRRDRARPPVREHRRPHRHDAHQRPADPRRAVRPGDDVRGGRPGHGHHLRAPELGARAHRAFLRPSSSTPASARSAVARSSSPASVAARAAATTS